MRQHKWQKTVYESVSKMCMQYFDKGQCKLFGLFSINRHINDHQYSNTVHTVNPWQLCAAHKASLNKRMSKLFSFYFYQQLDMMEYLWARAQQCQDSGSHPKCCHGLDIVSVRQKHQLTISKQPLKIWIWIFEMTPPQLCSPTRKFLLYFFKRVKHVGQW